MSASSESNFGTSDPRSYMNAEDFEGAPEDLGMLILRRSNAYSRPLRAIAIRTNAATTIELPICLGIEKVKLPPLTLKNPILARKCRCGTSLALIHI